MSAMESKEYGLIDEVLIQKPAARRQVAASTGRPRTRRAHRR